MSSTLKMNAKLGHGHQLAMNDLTKCKQTRLNMLLSIKAAQMLS